MNEANLISTILSGKSSEGIKNITEKIDQNIGPYHKKFDYQRFVKLMLDEEFKIKVLRNIIGSKIKKLKKSSPNQKLPVFIYKKKIPVLNRYFVFYWKDEDNYDYFLLPKVPSSLQEGNVNVFEEQSKFKELSDLDNYLLWFEFVFYENNKNNYPNITFGNKTIRSEDIFKKIFYAKNLLLIDNKTEEWNELLKDDIFIDYLEKLKNSSIILFDSIKNYIDRVSKFYRIVHGQNINLKGGADIVFEEIVPAISYAVPILHLESLKYHRELNPSDKKKLNVNLVENFKIGSLSQIPQLTGETSLLNKTTFISTPSNYEVAVQVNRKKLSNGDITIDSIINKKMEELSELLKSVNSNSKENKLILNKLKTCYEELKNTGKIDLFKKINSSGELDKYQSSFVNPSTAPKKKDVIKNLFKEIYVLKKLKNYFIKINTIYNVIKENLNKNPIIYNYNNNDYNALTLLEEYKISYFNLFLYKNESDFKKMYEHLFSIQFIQQIYNNNPYLYSLFMELNDLIYTCYEFICMGIPQLLKKYLTENFGPFVKKNDIEEIKKEILNFNPTITKPLTLSVSLSEDQKNYFKQELIKNIRNLLFNIKNISSQQTSTSSITIQDFKEFCNGEFKTYYLELLKFKEFTETTNLIGQTVNLYMNMLRKPEFDIENINNRNMSGCLLDDFDNRELIINNLLNFEEKWNEKINKNKNRILVQLLKDVKTYKKNNVQNIMNEENEFIYLLNKVKKINYYLFGLINFVRTSTNPILIKNNPNNNQKIVNFCNDVQFSLEEMQYVYYEFIINKNINKWNLFINDKFDIIFNYLNQINPQFANIFVECIEQMHYLYHLIYNIETYKKPQENISINRRKEIKKNNYIIQEFDNNNVIRNKRSILKKGLTYFLSFLNNIWTKPEQIEIISYILKGYQDDIENELNFYDNLSLKYGNYEVNDNIFVNEQGNYPQVNIMHLYLFYQIILVFYNLNRKISELRIEFKNKNGKIKEGNQLVQLLFRRFLKLFYLNDIDKWNQMLINQEMNIFLNMLYEQHDELYMIFIELVRNMYLFYRLIFKITDPIQNKEIFVPKKLSSEAQCILGIFTINSTLKNKLPRMLRNKFNKKREYNDYFYKYFICLMKLYDPESLKGNLECFNDTEEMLENVKQKLNLILIVMKKKRASEGGALFTLTNKNPTIQNKKLSSNKTKRLKLKVYKEKPVENIFNNSISISSKDLPLYTEKLVKQFICILKILGKKISDNDELSILVKNKIRIESIN